MPLSEVIAARFSAREARAIDNIAHRLGLDRSGVVRLAIGELVGRLRVSATDQPDIDRLAGRPLTEDELAAWVLGGLLNQEDGTP
jgi:predicted transcriptional regulator